MKKAPCITADQSTMQETMNHPREGGCSYYRLQPPPLSSQIWGYGMDKVKIDVSQIQAIEVKNLSRTLLAATERFYSDPENQRRFEAWQKSKETNGGKPNE